MNKLIKALKEFEEKSGIYISFHVIADPYYVIKDFYRDKIIYKGSSKKKLFKFLKKTKL